MSNNIEFNDKSLAVSYIQAFLRENYSLNVLPTGVYDLQTHEALIAYLEQPNVVDLSTAEQTYKEIYKELTTMFNLTRESDSLVFISKRIDKSTSDFIDQTLDDLKELSKSIGWELESYNDYVNYTLDLNNDNAVDNIDKSLLLRYLETGTGLTEEQLSKADFNMDKSVDQLDYDILSQYINNEKLYIKFKRQDREDYFPNKDILKFVNLFRNEFVFYKSIRDEEGDNYGTDDKVHDCPIGKHKISIIPCKPGTTYTIAHSSAYSQRLVIGSMTTNKRNLEVSKLLNVLDINLAPGNATLYTTSAEGDTATSRDAQYILIQCPSNIEDYSTLQEHRIPLMLGDINLDGKIDNLDRKLLADYLYYPENDINRPKLTKKQLAACDINNDGLPPSQEDLSMLVEYLDGERESLGIVEYKYYTSKEVNNLNNVASLLVMEGNWIEEDTGETKQCETNIFHPQETHNLYSSSSTHTNLNNIEIEIPYTPPENHRYDDVQYITRFTEVIGNTRISYFDTTKKISPRKPAKTYSVSDLKVIINNGKMITTDLSEIRLSKINNICDRIFSQQDKYYHSNLIEEIHSEDLTWVRRTTPSGYSYLRSNITVLKEVLSTDLPNLFSNKFEIVRAEDILNEIFTNQYEIAIDSSGRLMLYSSEINTLPSELDMLSWLANNKFYVLGERASEQIVEVSIEMPNLQLISGKNILNIQSDTNVPTKISLQTEVLGIINSFVETSLATFPVTRSPLGLNFASFTEDPWVVHHKIIPYLLGYAITPYSRSEEITYAQNLIQDIYPLYKGSFVPGIYSDLLKQLIEKFQRSYISYGKGDLNLDNSINLVDIKLVEGHLNGIRELTPDQQKSADVNGDSKLDINDLNIMYREYRGINDYLKTFDIPFIMGYIDPQTEYKMLKTLNLKLDKNKHEVGWNSSRPN